MAQYIVKSNDAQEYSLKLIRFAIRNRKADVVNILKTNGIAVPQNVDDKVLEAMVLKAMISSKSFKYSLIELLHTIAIEGEHKKGNYLGVDGMWYNSDGTQADDSSQDKLTISNDTFNGLISKGIDVLAYKLTDGNLDNTDSADANIKKVVDTNPNGNSSIKTMVVTAGIVVGTGFIMWYLLKKKK